MGNEWRTGFNLKILRINTKYNVVYVKVREPDSKILGKCFHKIPSLVFCHLLINFLGVIRAA